MNFIISQIECILSTKVIKELCVCIHLDACHETDQREKARNICEYNVRKVCAWNWINRKLSFSS